MAYPRVRLRALLAIFAGIAVAGTVTQALVSLLRGQPPHIGSILENELMVWLLFGALAPIAFFAARRFPLIGGRGIHHLPAHAGALAAISLSHTIVYSTVIVGLIGKRPSIIAVMVRTTAVANLRGDVFIYAMIVGAFYLYGYARRDHDVVPAAAVVGAAPAPFADRITVKDRDRITLVAVTDIERIEAEGDYVRIHTPAGSHLLREKLGGLDKRLDPNRFLRIHRSTIVRLGSVREVQPYFHGEYILVTASGARLKVSRTHRAALARALEIAL